MLPALLVVAGLFCVLFFLRLGGARRGALEYRWPVLLFAGAALIAATRGAIWPAVALSALAVLSWFVSPIFLAPRSPRSPQNGTAESRAEADARAVLGVPHGANEAEIRHAYRTKMASAHPDKGGRHAEAARLTAARDLLLKAKR